MVYQAWVGLDGHDSIPVLDAQYSKHPEAEDVFSAYVSPLSLYPPETTMKPYQPLTT